LLGVGHAALGCGTQQVNPALAHADATEGPAASQRRQHAELPALRGEHELTRTGRRRRGRELTVVVGRSLDHGGAGPLGRVHPSTTSTTAPSRNSSAGATSPSTATPSTVTDRTPDSTWSGLDTRTVTFAPRNRRRTSKPSQSAGIAGAMRRPPSTGCT